VASYLLSRDDGDEDETFPIWVTKYTALLRGLNEQAALE
jgi:hypothetical protein